LSRFVEDRTTTQEQFASADAQGREDQPAVPTVDETGPKGFEASGWFGVFVPAKTPPAVIAALAKAIQAAAQQPDFKERVNALGGEVTPLIGPGLQAFLKSESEKWSGIIKTNKITHEMP
jgi:tripartite-type tricarboxylate transporter receptor subunit TctC